MPRGGLRLFPMPTLRVARELAKVHPRDQMEAGMDRDRHSGLAIPEVLCKGDDEQFERDTSLQLFATVGRDHASPAWERVETQFQRLAGAVSPGSGRRPGSTVTCRPDRPGTRQGGPGSPPRSPLERASP